MHGKLDVVSRLGSCCLQSLLLKVLFLGELMGDAILKSSGVL